MKFKLAAFAIAAAAVAMPAHAADEVKLVSLDAIKAFPEYAEKIGDFKFVFGNAPGKGLGDTQTRKATGTIGKGKDKACAWAALSALIALKNDAVSRGGSSVQGLKSMVTGTEFTSATEVQCITGFTNSRVYLQGVVVK
jgi:hypothetical protein